MSARIDRVVVMDALPLSSARTFNRGLSHIIVFLFFGFAFVRGVQETQPILMAIAGAVIALNLVIVLGSGFALHIEHRRQLETGWLTRFPVTYRRIGSSVERTRGEHRATIGRGKAAFERAAAAVMRWEVKTRAGFQVIRIGTKGAFSSDEPVREDECAVIRFGPLRETVRAVRVVDKPRLRGFAYGTLPEHPLIGEEAFLVEWRDDDAVDFVIRSFSRPSGSTWWLLWPVLAIARQVFLRRYQRALVD
jgi:uncharacterized protein (UPF0548 family)